MTKNHVAVACFCFCTRFFLYFFVCLFVCLFLYLFVCLFLSFFHFCSTLMCDIHTYTPHVAVLFLRFNRPRVAEALRPPPCPVPQRFQSRGRCSRHRRPVQFQWWCACTSSTCKKCRQTTECSSNSRLGSVPKYRQAWRRFTTRHWAVPVRNCIESESEPKPKPKANFTQIDGRGKCECRFTNQGQEVTAGDVAKQPCKLRLLLWSWSLLLCLLVLLHR